MNVANDFYERLLDLTMSSWNNNLTDNSDPHNSRGDRITFHLQRNSKTKESFLEYLQQYKSIGSLYAMLDNAKSKDLLLHLMAFWAMGEQKIRLPIDRNVYFEALSRSANWRISNLANPTITSGEYTLACYDLNHVGINQRLYASPPGIGSIWFLKQYEYDDENVSCKPQLGDTVIDCGGCWGDTTLYFADRVGDNGHVFVFEFIPSHLKVINHNIELNPHLKKCIEIIPNPVWSTSGEKLYFVDWGPGSRLSSDPNRYNYDGTTETLSIDDLVLNSSIKKVDYIKMDIEGAELNALKGATNTICRDRPKLAISLYHSLQDFVTIPTYIKSLELGYSFYIKHHTLFENETVLYAIPQN
jgi:FkbM family methyltransferase